MSILNIMSSAIVIWTVIATSTLAQSDVVPPGMELLFACKRGDLAEVRQQLGTECTDVNKPFDDKYLPLVEAVRSNNTQVVMLLLACGADPNRSQGGQTALLNAAYYASVDVVRILLGAHADIDTQNENNGHTALMWASEVGNIQTVKTLISAGANINLQAAGIITAGSTALIQASIYNHLDVVKMLISAGAEIDTQDQEGATALIRASELGYFDVVEELILAGAEIDQQMNKNQMFKGQTALMGAVAEANGEGHLQVINVLAESGANMTIQNTNGETALHIATKNNPYNNLIHMVKNPHASIQNSITYNNPYNIRVRMVKTLLMYGADVEIKSKSGDTAEDLARKNGFTDIVMLIQQSTMCSNLYQ